MHQKTSNVTTTTFGVNLTTAGDNAVITPVNTIVDEVENSQWTTVKTSSYGAIQNQDVLVLTSTAGGAITGHTLPAISGSNKSVTLKKLSSDYSEARWTRSGSDVIEDYNSPLLTPVATTISLYHPDEAVELVPTSSNGWRVVYRHFTNRVKARVFKQTAVQTITTAAAQKVTLTAETYDYANTYDTANSRFVTLVPGYRYRVNGVVTINGGSSAQVGFFLFKNGSYYEKLGTTPLGTSSCDYTVMSSEIVCSSATDYIEIYSQAFTNSRDINFGTTDTWFQFTLVKE